MKTFKWVVEFEVTENWVADGFNIDQRRAFNMIEGVLPYASGMEIKATVKKSPSEAAIKKAQGYK
jgi:hypothetical protein